MLYSRDSALTCLDKSNQLFHIVKIVIVADNAVPMIDNPILLIPFQTIQKMLFAVFSDKQIKSVWLDFMQ